MIELGSNYEKNLFKQLQETMAKVEKLSSEIVMLKSSHAQEIDTLKKEIKILKEENICLKEENQKLKDILNKNSNNSSKPPSTDGFKKEIHNSRIKSEKKPGGQYGHKGKIPMLYKNPTEIVEHKEERCECGSLVRYEKDYKAKQHIDIKIELIITEHRIFTGVCSCCRKKVINKSPIMDILTYGENLKALTAMLSNEGMVSVNRIKTMLTEITNVDLSISEGTIVKWNQELHENIKPVIENIKENLSTKSVLHKDETGVRINGKMNWLHVLSDKKNTLYFADKKRGNEADKSIGVLTSYSGVLVHDHLKGLYKFPCEHAECNAHILRYLKSAAENKKRTWATMMIAFFVNANDAIKACKAENIEKLSASELSAYISQYDEILELARQEFLQSEKKDYNGEDMKLMRRLKEYKQEHLRFIADFRVPFDNNQAERDLRMIKAKTKISGCFRSETGCSAFASIKSYCSTLRKNNKNIFQGLKLAFLFNPIFC